MAIISTNYEKNTINGNFDDLLSKYNCTVKSW